MSFVSSKNLIHEDWCKPYTKRGFVLNQAVDGLLSDKYLCPFCKKIHVVSPFVTTRHMNGTQSHSCQECGTQLFHISDVYGCPPCYKKYNDVAWFYSCQSYPTVLIGEEYDDVDGHLVSVVGTIFIQEHMLSIKKDKSGNPIETYTTYTWKKRVILNLDMNQIYTVITNSTPSNNGFSHFTINNASFRVDDRLYTRLLRHMIEIVYEKRFHLSLPKSVQQVRCITTSVAFYLMKFPCITHVAFENKYYDVSPSLLSLFYWLCNYDRKLRAMITCRNLDEYNQMWSTYLSKCFGIFSDNVFTDFSPWFLLTAWQLGHMGFKEIDSVMAITNVLLNTQSHSSVSVYVWVLFLKRSHAWNKLMRRMIRMHGEDYVVHMLLSSKYQRSYNDFIYMYKRDVESTLTCLDVDDIGEAVTLDFLFF